MRISVEDLFEGVATGDAADDDAQGHACTLDARVAMMNGRVNHDSVAPVHGNTSTEQNQKYTTPDCSDSPTPLRNQILIRSTSSSEIWSSVRSYSFVVRSDLLRMLESGRYDRLKGQ